MMSVSIKLSSRCFVVVPVSFIALHLLLSIQRIERLNLHLEMSPIQANGKDGLFTKQHVLRFAFVCLWLFS